MPKLERQGSHAVAPFLPPANKNGLLTIKQQKVPFVDNTPAGYRAASRILIVDDVPAYCQELRAILEANSARIAAIFSILGPPSANR